LECRAKWAGDEWKEESRARGASDEHRIGGWGGASRAQQQGMREEDSEKRRRLC
jgi:hypothetical protein